MHKFFTGLAVVVAAVAFVLSPVQSHASTDTFTFGLLMVGPSNDHGWSQAHFEAGKEIEKNIPGSKMIYIDKVNPADKIGRASCRERGFRAV